MVSKLVRRASIVLVAVHGLLWAAAMAAWLVGWREYWPIGPTFNGAKDFLSFIDVWVACPLDAFSQMAALKAGQWFGVDLGVTYTILFGCLILPAGTLQWFLTGRLIQWVAAKYGMTSAVVLGSGIACGISLAFVGWATSW